MQSAGKFFEGFQMPKIVIGGTISLRWGNAVDDSRCSTRDLNNLKCMRYMEKILQHTDLKDGREEASVESMMCRLRFRIAPLKIKRQQECEGDIHTITD